ncbi:MAG TPA: helix-turn-helix transcriptional regulator [Dehalococcoidia bacterium]|nr:helix-turn-helix transcriptional regulator [Dehalococcoidia bacterium]
MKTFDPVRVQPKVGESLTVLLQLFAQRAQRRRGKSQAQIARDAWLDESYVSRLFSGERSNPSREALILLGCWGLELAVEEVDELLLAADYKPLVLPVSIR